jgi:cytochrome c oxidase assembly protein subunit 15
MPHDPSAFGPRREPAPYHPWRHRLSLLLAALTPVLIVWGAMVTSKDAGLSVPDWPTAYDYWWLPIEMWVGNIFWEHTHRLFAATIGFITMVLAIWTAVAEPRRWVRLLAAGALCAVVVQGILGGVTVHLRLPVLVSSSHATLAQLFFCLTLTIAFVMRRGFVEAPSIPHGEPLGGLRRLLLVVLAAILLQLVLGAVMRHSNAGLAVPDFPTAFGDVVPGQIIPSVSDEAIDSYNHFMRSYHLDTYDEAEFRTTREKILIHMAHRLWACVVAALVVAVAIVLLRRHGSDPFLRRGGFVLLLLIVSQFTLGMATVWTHKAPFVTSLHVMIGAVTLGATYLVAMRAWQLCDGAVATATATVAKSAAAAAPPQPKRTSPASTSPGRPGATA